MTTACSEADLLITSMPTPQLEAIASKVVQGQRLSPSEGLHVMTTEHREALRKLADYARKVKVGDVVTFTSTLYIHPTNLCELSCPMCSYYAKPGWNSAWLMTPDQVESKVKEFNPKGITEVHIVGGLWRGCDLSYYQDIFARIKQINPKLHIKALTPVEYDFLAKHHGISVEEVFHRMISWGLGSLPGGVAEVLVEKIRKQLAPQKISSDEYLDIHRTAHRLGLPSNITVLIGSVEEDEDLVTHMCRVRELQDETKGFQAFVPLKYHLENNALGKRQQRMKPKDIFRVYATSRLMLDNVPDLRVQWNYVGIEEAQQMLNWGANHFSATSFEEKIILMAGGTTVKMTHDGICELIRSMGRIPKQSTGHAHRA